MNNTAKQSRRQALKVLAGLPLFPLAASMPFKAFALNKGATVLSTRFIAMPAPTLANPVEMATVDVKSSMQVLLSDQSAITYQLAYRPFFMTGDMVANGRGGKILAGGYVDINNKPIIDRSVAGKERQFFSDCPDGTSLLTVKNAKVAGVKGNTVFAVVQFEYTSRNQAGDDVYGMLPSPIAVLTLDQDPKSGNLKLVKYHNVDTSSAHGLWITCGSSLSPWGTHLSSEEYEPDAMFIQKSKEFKNFSQNLYGDEHKANPYHYGHLPEVTVNPDGTGSIKKHYCLGRISHELIQVMPDNRTALMGDDYTNGGLFLFVADKEKDLSAGTLYVAKFAPGLSPDTNAPAVNLEWIQLGHATSAEVEHMANTLKPEDIMTVVAEDPKDSSFTKVIVDGKNNWVKVKPGMEKAAAFLETHRYANLKGASMALTKLEGTTVNIKDKEAYSALSYIQKSMVKGDKAWRESTNVGFPESIFAGGILAHTLTGGLKDTEGRAMQSEWVPAKTRMLLTGKDIPSDALGNTADPDNIANPDNLKFSEKMRTLFIGEDSGLHVNNYMWAYNVDTKELSRILSTPSGAESTGLQAADEINGWTYIMSNFQHAGDWLKIHKKVEATLDPIIRQNYKDRFGASVGYLTTTSTAIKLAE